MAADSETRQRILRQIPQQPPFRFVDELIELDEEGVTGVYTFREDEYFYRGHFPGRPVTPGVILIETMAQAGLVALGLYLMTIGTGEADLRNRVSLFTFADEVEFTALVFPGEKVVARGEKIYFRKDTLKARVGVVKDDLVEVCSGVLTGAWVRI